MNKIMIFVFSILSLNLQALSIQPVGKPVRTLNISDVDIPVAEKMKVEGVAKTPIELKLTGAGVREKKVVIASVNVYFVASYADNSDVMNSQNRLLKLTFLRDVGAEKIRNSFTDALKENDVDVESKEFKKILDAIQFDVKKGGGVDFLGIRTGDKENLKLIFPEKTIESEGKRVVSDFWKIYFGKPADGGLEDLKPRLQSLDQFMHM